MAAEHGRVAMDEIADRLSFLLGEAPPFGPIGTLRRTGTAEVDGVRVEDYAFTDGLGEESLFSVATPPAVRHEPWALALHQTNECGRLETLGRAGDAAMAYGLDLARQGFRVLAPEGAFTPQRQPEAPWNTTAFYRRFPGWSALGREIAGLGWVLDVAASEFGLHPPVVAVGHSQGGVYAGAAAALDARVRCCAAHAAYFDVVVTGLTNRRLGGQFDLLRPELIRPAEHRPEALLDDLLMRAGRQAAVLLVCKTADHLLCRAVPDAAARQRWASAGDVAVCEWPGVHALTPVAREWLVGFVSEWAARPGLKAVDWLAANPPPVTAAQEGEFRQIGRVLDEFRTRLSHASEAPAILEEMDRQIAELSDSLAHQEQRGRDLEEQLSEQREALDDLARRYREDLDAVQVELADRRGLRGAAKEILRTLKRRTIGPKLHVPQPSFGERWELLDEAPPTRDGPLKVLVLSHMFPHPEQPASGPFIFEQVKALRRHADVDARVLVGRPFWMRTRGRLLKLGKLEMAYRRFHAACRWTRLDGVPVLYLPYRIVGPFFTHARTYRAALIRRIEEIHATFPFDLVHAHTAYLDGSAGQAIARRYGVPTVITEHTGPFDTLTANPRVRRWTLRALEGADRILAVSRAQAEAVGEHLSPAARGRLAVVGNVVDAERFRPGPRWAPDPDRPRILFVGFFVPIKNLPVLLAAFQHVVETVPGARLRLVGGGEHDRQQRQLHQQTERMGLADRVEVLGYQPPGEIARMMREDCDVLVLPSAAETFGCVLIEALASGKPVVATRCGGPEDIVDDPSLGALCPPGDPDALAGALVRVIRSLRRYDPAALRSAVVERFGPQAIAGRLTAEYRLAGVPVAGAAAESAAAPSALAPAGPSSARRS